MAKSGVFRFFRHNFGHKCCFRLIFLETFVKFLIDFIQSKASAGTCTENGHTISELEI